MKVVGSLMKRSIKFIVIVTIAIMLFSGCSKNNDEFLSTCIGYNVSGEGIEENFMGFPEITGTHNETYVYKDKSYSCYLVTYSSDGGMVKVLESEGVLSEWDDLRPLLQGKILMNEGDIAMLSAEDFIAYLNDTYP